MRRSVGVTVKVVLLTSPSRLAKTRCQQLEASSLTPVSLFWARFDEFGRLRGNVVGEIAIADRVVSAVVGPGPFDGQELDKFESNL